MNAPKISVVIPTRERLPVLRHCLRTVLTQNYQNLQIIVSDNASTDGTGAFIRSLDDPRLHYVNAGRRVSMSDNWEFALSHVDDGWVTFLGDDDGLMPGAVERLAEIIGSTDCEAITYGACNYVWPGPSGSEIGRLVVPLTCGRSETRKAGEWLARVIDGRAQYSDLPNLYVLGCVHMNVIKRLQGRRARFFNSSIPDIYATMALARAIDTYLYIDKPLALIGSSKFSNGTSFQSEGESTSGTGEIHRFMAEMTIPFHRDIPMRKDGGLPPNPYMYVYESFLQSRFIDPDGKTPEPIPGRQLELALTHPYAPGRLDKLNEEWGREFARKYSLDFESILRRSRRQQRLLLLTIAVQRLRLAFKSLVVYDRAVPLDNIFAASVAAAAVCWVWPSRVLRLRRALSRLRDRLRQPSGSLLATLTGLTPSRESATKD
jgi:hypothetical protein